MAGSAPPPKRTAALRRLIFLVEARGIEPRSQDAPNAYLRVYPSDLHHPSGDRDGPAPPKFTRKILAVALLTDATEQPAKLWS